MQISTSHFYSKALENMQQAQHRAGQLNEQLATGKNLVRPSDDTSKLRELSSLDRALMKAESLNNNIDGLMAIYGLEESALFSASDILIRVKELAIQGSNGSMSSINRSVIAEEIKSLTDQLLSLANSKDSQGNSIFSGSNTEVEPFQKLTDGTTRYVGDTTGSQVQIGVNRSIEKNRPGTDVFDGVVRADAFGNIEKIGFFDVLSELQQNLERKASTEVVVPISLLSTTSGELEINGIQIAQEDDQNTATELVDLINEESSRTNVVALINEKNQVVLKNIIGREDDPIVFGAQQGILGGIVGEVGPSTDLSLYERSVSEVETLHSHLTLALGRIGSRIGAAEYQQELNFDSELRLKQLKASHVDVDFSEAVTKFNAELTRLEASQAAFGKLSKLSLFDYL